MQISLDTLFETTKSILAQINDGEYPQAYEYLDDLLDDLDLKDATPYDIAHALVRCDKPKKLPSFLIDFITSLFEYEIAEGNADAMVELGGEYYDGGRGFEQSFSKAVALYKMAADHGNRYAFECLGYCYYYGRDMEPDYEKAFKCFSMGALVGSLQSMYKLGDMYLRGQFVDKDEREAFIIYSRCNQMISDSDRDYVAGPVHLRLGHMYLNGWGTKQDAEEALIHYSFAEYMLYRMVKSGNFMYKKSLCQAIEGHENARTILNQGLPEEEWIDEPI